MQGEPEIKVTATMEYEGRTVALAMLVEDDEARNQQLFRHLVASMRWTHQALSGADGDEAKQRALAAMEGDE